MIFVNYPAPVAYPLIPLPMTQKPLPGGTFEFKSSTKIHTERPLFAITKLKQLLPGQKFESAPARAADQINFRFEQSLLPEQYILNIAKTRIDIAYGDANAALYAVQTIRQLLTENSLPTIRIEDQPRFSWRGVHLDVSRHFFPAPVIKQLLDRMADLKLNRFHWHLVDDGGWRIQLDQFPDLTRKGAFRSEETWSYSKINLTRDTAAYGGFYTKAEVREIVAYAADRGIVVVPEIELPGHTLPSIHAYPELGCRDAKKYPTNTWTTNVYCAGKEQVFNFLSDVMTEVIELFPSKWIHIGGDEVDKKWWTECEDCQKRRVAEGLINQDELQSYFIRRIEKMVNAKGRTVIGWDEILEGGLAPNATVMSWRGEEGGIRAAQSGHEVVMTPTSHCYFDYGYESTSTERVYSWEPVPKALSAEESKRVLGGQANVWTEWIPDTKKLDLMLWPRLFAMSEVLWSSAPKDWGKFSQRLDASVPLLEGMGIHYYLEEPRLESGFVFSKAPGMLSAKDFGRAIFTSTDPKAPASEWRPLTTQEVPVNRMLYLAYKRKDGSLGDAAQYYRSDRAGSTDGAAGTAGLNVEFWEGSFKSCTVLDEVTAKGKGIASSIGLVARPKPNDYGLRFTGRIKFPGRKFRLYLTADDGAVLKLNGVKVIDHDGNHAESTKSVGIEVTEGSYDFELRYIEAGGASALRLEVEGSGLRRQPVPESWFSH